MSLFAVTVIAITILFVFYCPLVVEVPLAQKTETRKSIFANAIVHIIQCVCCLSENAAQEQNFAETL